MHPMFLKGPGVKTCDDHYRVLDGVLDKDCRNHCTALPPSEDRYGYKAGCLRALAQCKIEDGLI